MSKFKIGDKVRCTKSYRVSQEDQIVKGKNYYVIEAGEYSVRVNNDAPVCWWEIDHFEKVPSNGKTKR